VDFEAVCGSGLENEYISWSYVSPSVRRLSSCIAVIFKDI